MPGSPSTVSDWLRRFIGVFVSHRRCGDGLAIECFHYPSAIASISLVATSRLAALHEQAQRGRVPKRVQLNVRIDSALKARFDAVVGAEGLGVGPSAYLEAVLEDVLPESERALEELNRADDKPTATRLKARKSS